MKLIEKGFINRNKKVILIAVIIMLLSAVAGTGMAYMKADGNYNIISKELSSQEIKNTQPSNDTDTGMSAIGYFIHNTIADLFVIIGGIFFSIISVILVIFNGITIGGLFGMDLPYAMTSILPHGIIEYFAGALALAIAFKITQLEIKMIKNRSFKSTLNDNETFLKDILVILIVMLVLLAIAGIIEAHITPMVVKGYFGI